MTISIRASIILLFLLGLLYFSLQNAIQQAPSIHLSLEQVAEATSFAKFSLRELEVFLKGLLEKARSGESISHESEVNLKKIEALLRMHPTANQQLVAKLIALIHQILELNGEIIHEEDGEHQSDNH
jgi:hypothetical protein